MFGMLADGSSEEDEESSHQRDSEKQVTRERRDSEVKHDIKPAGGTWRERRSVSSHPSESKHDQFGTWRERRSIIPQFDDDTPHDFINVGTWRERRAANTKEVTN